MIFNPSLIRFLHLLFHNIPLKTIIGVTMLELNIIIVGAGIAGLASAITLSRAGHNVQVSTISFQAGLKLHQITNETVP
jgi:monoamine oxidase